MFPLIFHNLTLFFSFHFNSNQFNLNQSKSNHITVTPKTVDADPSELTCGGWRLLRCMTMRSQREKIADIRRSCLSNSEPLSRLISGGILRLVFHFTSNLPDTMSHRRIDYTYQASVFGRVSWMNVCLSKCMNDGWWKQCGLQWAQDFHNLLALSR
jgi:hypothetical protein